MRPPLPTTGSGVMRPATTIDWIEPRSTEEVIGAAVIRVLREAVGDCDIIISFRDGRVAFPVLKPE